jgi:hypothetical protein
MFFLTLAAVEGAFAASLFDSAVTFAMGEGLIALAITLCIGEDLVAEVIFFTKHLGIAPAWGKLKPAIVNGSP